MAGYAFDVDVSQRFSFVNPVDFIQYSLDNVLSRLALQFFNGLDCCLAIREDMDVRKFTDLLLE